MPGYHAMLGMQAFGFEEMGDYARAETLGRAAIELEPRDGWAQHAVAHVMEMQCRQRDGIAWMRANTEAWTKESFLQVHNWWHLALFHYDLGEIDEVLALYRRADLRHGTRRWRSTCSMPRRSCGGCISAASMSATAGRRWPTTGRRKPGDGNYAFNDIARDDGFRRRRAAASRRDACSTPSAQAMAGDDDNAGFTRDVGHPVALGDQGIRRGRLCRSRAPDQARSAPSHYRFGGSHAQRDVIDLTLIEAAIRAGDRRIRAGPFRRTR